MSEGEAQDPPQAAAAPGAEKRVLGPKALRRREARRAERRRLAAQGPATTPTPKASDMAGIKPVATKARAKRRHWGLLFSFMMFVLVPFGVTAFYLWAVAQDQYTSTTGFTVRQEDGAAGVDLLGILPDIGGSGGASDSDILYEFIQSQVIVERVLQDIDLQGIYSENWDTDPVFSLWPDAQIEEIVWYWKRVVSVSYDQGSGLIELQVIAPRPETAQRLARLIVAESQQMINDLNTSARADTMRYATADLDVALERLRTARQALTAFRTRTQIVDPEADIESRLGVLGTLQQQLAQAYVDYDLLRLSAQENDPRVLQAQRRIDVIRGRIADERTSFTLNEGRGEGEDYPALIAEYESLVVDREFAETTYRSSLAALDIAQSEANRQSRYLAAYIEPTLAQASAFPNRFTLAGLVGMFLLLAWSVMALVYYALRDRR